MSIVFRLEAIAVPPVVRILRPKSDYIIPKKHHEMNIVLVIIRHCLPR